MADLAPGVSAVASAPAASTCRGRMSASGAAALDDAEEREGESEEEPFTEEEVDQMVDQSGNL